MTKIGAAMAGTGNNATGEAGSGAAEAGSGDIAIGLRLRGLGDDMADAAHRIEQLRSEQDRVERRRSLLQDTARRQKRYQRAKRETLQELDRAILMAEREEARARSIFERLHAAGERFAALAADLRSIDEAAWPERDFAAELNRAAAAVDAASAEHRAAMARLEALGWQAAPQRPAAATASGAGAPAPARDRGVLYWLKVGFALGLPLALYGAALLVAYLLLAGLW